MPRTTRAAAAAKAQADATTNSLPEAARSANITKPDREQLRSIGQNSFDGTSSGQHKGNLVEEEHGNEMPGQRTKAKKKAAKRKKARKAKAQKTKDLESESESAVTAPDAVEDEQDSDSAAAPDSAGLPESVQEPEEKAELRQAELPVDQLHHGTESQPQEMQSESIVRPPVEPDVVATTAAAAAAAAAAASESVQADVAEPVKADEPEPATANESEPVKAEEPNTELTSRKDSFQDSDPSPLIEQQASIITEADSHYADQLHASSVLASPPDLKQISTAASTVLTSPTLSSPLSEDPIDAIDALEDALEEIGKSLPVLTSPVSPEKPSAPKVVIIGPDSSSNGRSNPSRTNHAPTKDVTTKAELSQSTSRLRRPGGPTLTKTTQTSALSHSASARAGPIARPAPLSQFALTKSRLPTAGSEEGSTAHATEMPSGPSKYFSTRRPISMQFPTPPPPSKSTKPLTKSNFTLPGEAIAAKLRAAREERQKREEEEAARRKEFKARPIPSAPKNRPASMIVRQTASSRARMSFVGDGIACSNETENGVIAGSGLKRSGTVTGVTSGSTYRESTASKRSSMIAQKTGGMSTSTKPAAPNTSQKRASAILGSSQIGEPSRSSLPKRQSNIMATTQPSAVNRSTPAIKSPLSQSVSSLPLATKLAVTAEDVVVQRQKAREIFNRDRVEKEGRERDRREKEEAAKRARADAAERGRQASREWAEKQKKKVLEARREIVGAGVADSH